MLDRHTPVNSGNASSFQSDARALANWQREFERDVRSLFSSPNDGLLVTRLLARPCVFPEALLHKVSFIIANPELADWVANDLDMLRVLLSSFLCLRVEPEEQKRSDLLGWNAAATASAEVRAFQAVLEAYLSAQAAWVGCDDSDDDEEEIRRGFAVGKAFDRLMAAPCATAEIVVRKARHLLTSEEHADHWWEFPEQVKTLLASLLHLKGGAA